jgi:mannose-P-dolichol utilization defect protein 1
MQLPAFIRDPAVAVIGDKCYSSLIEDLNLGDVDCIKYSISKAIGIAMILGGSIVKIPQILTITRNQSAEGLSIASYILETLSYSITTSYNFRQHNPFSTFGEIMLILIQNVIITMLIFHYSGKQSMMAVTLVGVATILYALNNDTIVPATLMNSLFAATIPLNMASKVPQIYTNFKNKSTGQLSIFAVVSVFSIFKIF